MFAPLQNWRILITAPFFTVPVPMPCARADLPVPRALGMCHAENIKSVHHGFRHFTEHAWVETVTIPL